MTIDKNIIIVYNIVQFISKRSFFMSTHTPITNVGFTSEAHWGNNEDPADITKPDSDHNSLKPKSLPEQVAKTPKGLAMQQYAEQVRDDIEASIEDKFDAAMDVDVDEIHRMIERESLSYLGFQPNGKVEVEGDISSLDLKSVKERLLDLKLPRHAQIREIMQNEVNYTVGKLDEAIELRKTAEAAEKAAREAEKATEEAPDVITEALTTITSLQRAIKRAITEKSFDELTGINKQLVEKAVELRHAFDSLRQNDPDKMLDLVNELEAQGFDLKPYKTALINFARTHNHFTFSDETLRILTYQAMEDERYDFRRKGKPSFNQAILSAYRAPIQEDDPYTFLLETTRIPEHRFKPIVREVVLQS